MATRPIPKPDKGEELEKGKLIPSVPKVPKAPTPNPKK